MFAILLASSAHGGTDPCFPLQGAVADAASLGLFSARIVVEEWSRCKGVGATATYPIVELPEQSADASSLLTSLVSAYNSASVDGLDYVVSLKGDLWVIEPKGVDPLIETHVDITPGPEGTVAAEERSVWEQLFAKRKVWIGVRGFEDARDTTKTTFEAKDVAIVDALAELYAPLEQAVKSERKLVGDSSPVLAGSLIRVYSATHAGHLVFDVCADPSKWADTHPRVPAVTPK